MLDLWSAITELQSRCSKLQARIADKLSWLLVDKLWPVEIGMHINLDASAAKPSKGLSVGVLLAAKHTVSSVTNQTLRGQCGTLPA